jgi:hypothetical protein
MSTDDTIKRLLDEAQRAEDKAARQSSIADAMEMHGYAAGIRHAVEVLTPHLRGVEVPEAAPVPLYRLSAWRRTRLPGDSRTEHVWATGTYTEDTNAEGRTVTTFTTRNGEVEHFDHGYWIVELTEVDDVIENLVLGSLAATRARAAADLAARARRNEYDDKGQPYR